MMNADADWNPDLYLKFSDQRARPAADMIAQVRLENPKRIIDLGCGTGNSTEQAHARWPKAEIIGLDSSASMLKQAGVLIQIGNGLSATLKAGNPTRPLI